MKTTISRTISINGVTYESIDAIPPDIREKYSGFIKMLEADADGNGVPDIIEDGRFSSGLGELVTERLVEVRTNHRGMGEIINPEVLPQGNVISPKVQVEKRDARYDGQSTVQRPTRHAGKLLFFGVIMFLIGLYLGFMRSG